MIGFEGFGSALKPAYEPVWMCRKPIAERNIIENVLAHGTGAINVDGCRVGTNDSLGRPYGGGNQIYGTYSMERGTRTGDELSGRWPANLIHDGSDEVVGLFPVTTKGGVSTNPNGTSKDKHVYSGGWNGTDKKHWVQSGDSGSAARFFKCCPMDDPDAEVKRLVYCAKASRADRNSGGVVSNIHSTVKPQSLCQYLVKLVTPPGGVVLDCFMGSGSVGVAAVKEGFRFVGIEKSPAYFEIAKARLLAAIEERRRAVGAVGQGMLPLVGESGGGR